MKISKEEKLKLELRDKQRYIQMLESELYNIKQSPMFVIFTKIQELEKDIESLRKQVLDIECN